MLSSHKCASWDAPSATSNCEVRRQNLAGSQTSRPPEKYFSGQPRGRALISTMLSVLVKAVLTISVPLCVTDRNCRQRWQMWENNYPHTKTNAVLSIPLGMNWCHLERPLGNQIVRVFLLCSWPHKQNTSSKVRVQNT